MGNLLKNNQNLMSEYNYKKNKSIDIEKLTNGSSKKVWWKCSECGYEWEAIIKNRVKGTGCPNCSLKLIGKNKITALIKKNGSLADNRPDLVEEWDYEKNLNIKPNEITCGSKKKVWWKCKNGHEWESTIYNRNNGSNCIYCAGQKAIEGENDLITTNPELLEEWDYEKNGDLKPSDFKSGSNKKVWWKCELGHSWKTSINHRFNGTGCPKCYTEYGTSFPEQAICYYLSKIVEVENRKKLFEQEVDIYLPEYKLGLEYDGSFFHNNEKSKLKEGKKDKILGENGIQLFRIKESQKEVFDKDNKIIYCVIDNDYKYLKKVISYIGELINVDIGNVDIKEDRLKIYKQYVNFVKVNNFTKKYPQLIDEWDYDKNQGLSPEYFSAGSNKKVWWKCNKCNSLYESTINHKIEGNGCPYCSGKKVNETNCLMKKHPELSKYWDYEKNDITPDKIYFRSRKKIWWSCSKCNKTFEAAICTRIKSKHYACKECMHKIIGNENRKNALKKGSLMDNRKDLVEEWDFDKNIEISPSDISCGSGKLVWWKCSKCGYEWQAKVFNRTNGTGCPICKLKK